MFVKAIEKASGYLRPVHVVYRYYNENVVNKTALTIMFVNEYGVAITARHVAEHIEQLAGAGAKYRSFLREKARLGVTTRSAKLRILEKKYGYGARDTFPVVNASLKFHDCFTEPSPKFRFIHHSREDLSLMIFENFGKRLYSYARFVSDKTKIKPGLSVCKLGFINPQFSDFEFDPGKDEIRWTGWPESKPQFFPVEGIVTRNLIRGYHDVYALETSTPGLPGQSGGPLVNTKGEVCGININVDYLEFRYDFRLPYDKPLEEKVTISYQPKFIVSNCLHADIIKLFLKAHKIKFHSG